MSIRGLASVLVLSLVLAPAAVRAEMPAQMAGKPEDVGLSSTQLQRLVAATKKNIDDGLMPGAVMLVARRGKVAWVSVQGKRAPDADDAMKFDSIFRIYSMTKPITSLVLMQLVEEGRLQVYDPVAKYLPEIGKMKVGTEVTVDGQQRLRLSDPDRQMTVQDLLRHTAGLTYGARGTSLVNKAYIDAKIGDRTATNEEMVRRLSGVPLLFSPGDRWEYSVAVDVQGRLIEVLTGKTLLEAFNERVFQPLGMVDTAFQVPAGKLARAAQPGQKPNGPPMTPRFKVDDGAKYESGGGGLLGTTEDYLRFSLALANGGVFQGKRIIGRKTLEFMTADHVGNRPGRPDGFGFGLGVEVRTKVGESALMGSVGEYGWSGAAGTEFWIDPKEELVGLYMVQASEGDTRFLRRQFRSMVGAALID
ncbi:serine hydrolase domain-containing protein [Reyranella soli]|uniref:Serine hydrolase n=1 Tax=Reyranella soli TaxID=1230389 RepID=A0A512NAI6_9HYPH|nr:serine hydrolase domain-containing protein [Reyranella soli]GEP55986.1 serine hydrolase [Reyranella soli]